MRIAGQPIAEEGKQLAQLDRIASIEAQKRTDPRLHHESRAYQTHRQPSERLHPGWFPAKLVITWGHFKPPLWGQFKLTSPRRACVRRVGVE